MKIVVEGAKRYVFEDTDRIYHSMKVKSGCLIIFVHPKNLQCYDVGDAVHVFNKAQWTRAFNE